MPASDPLLAAAEAVDVIDAAGRIIANPRRHAPSAKAGEVLALAHATEKFWAVAIEAELLVRALALPAESEADQDLRDDAIARQADEIKKLMAAIRGDVSTGSTPKE